jgi:carbonic anhydrase
MIAVKFFIVLAALQGALSAPIKYRRDCNCDNQGRGSQTPDNGDQNPTGNSTTNDLDMLFKGNQKFIETINKTEPGLLPKLAQQGQHPPFLFVGCSDSRVSEGTIFSADPGELFTHRNIANQYHLDDPNVNSVAAYAITALGVRHIIIMGHYGCGGVAAAIAPPPAPPIDPATAAIQEWINPIRDVYAESTRPEVVALREKNANLTKVDTPAYNDTGFRALVEENVKATVQVVYKSTIYQNQLGLVAKADNSTVQNNVESRAAPAAPVDVFIHGWVFEIETGGIVDLGVSVGPPGKPIPKMPFPPASNSTSTAPESS